MTILAVCDNKQNTLTLMADYYTENAKDRETLGKFEYGDLTLAFMGCVNKEVDRLATSATSADFYDLENCTYKQIFAHASKNYRTIFDLFADTPITARYLIYNENLTASSQHEQQEEFIDFCFNLEQSIRSRTAFTIYKRKFKSREAAILGAEKLDSWVQTPSVLFQVKKNDFSSLSGIVCENESYNIEPRSFSCFFEYDDDFNVNTIYKIHSITELIALDYISFLTSPTISGTIGICLNCRTVFKSTRSDAIYCSQSCGAKNQSQKMTEYDKKYRHYRKMSTAYLPGDECKELRKRWRDEAVSLMELIEKGKLQITAKEYGNELKNKLSAYCELNNKNGKRRSQ